MPSFTHFNQQSIRPTSLGWTHTCSEGPKGFCLRELNVYLEDMKKYLHCNFSSLLTRTLSKV